MACGSRVLPSLNIFRTQSHSHSSETMSKSFQHQKPPSRVDLTLDVDTGDASEEVELPLRLLVTSDLTGKKEDVPIDEREIVSVTDSNFEEVMESYDLSLEYSVPDRLTGDGELAVDLEFDTLDSFEPEAVAQQIPELSRLLAARNLLKDLRNRLISMGEFREQLEDVIQDETMKEELLNELQNIVPEEGGGATEKAQGEGGS
ncbi:type VI secretion system contractile sheath small subunit [Salinibacter sp. 10B]|uniref:type VI secretion system contractile sheath small subunit n=1 Tax=Salinibacter sp. 10B TaxID=1923971 RepID=UPI000CF440DC